MPVHRSKGGWRLGNWHATNPASSAARSPPTPGPLPPTQPAPRRCGMTATSRAPRRPRIRARGPPPAPTPIRTARGARSAAADELVLAEFLEASLRVPDLALPPPRKRFSFPPAPAPPPPTPREVSSQALASGDACDAALRAAISAAAESGAFAVAGAIDAREVRGAVEAARAVFAAPDEAKREQLARWFRRRDPVAGGEEFCWFRPVSPNEDRALGAALPGSTYRMFREKMDTVASKMENVAKNSIRVLSDSVKAPKDSALSRESPSILCLTLHNANKSKTSWNEFGSTDPPNSHALSIQLSGGDRQICLRNQGGSTVFSLPAGSMLVTIGKQVQVSCYRYIHYSSLSILKTAKMIKSTHKRCLNLHLYSVKYGMVQWAVQDRCWRATV
ncbi:uncharacterized protein LOC112894271 isoform X2 [Panicum hallii]|uniref:uncharacterized protein LOC112894271 isoform X2 n=1 Tax=Panicum hallii TaxID=206008 RepID=UPI000DF4E396|nr:uncharacterized protein LOC112894271 isoform X2 [Panicum hallii]